MYNAIFQVKMLDEVKERFLVDCCTAEHQPPSETACPERIQQELDYYASTWGTPLKASYKTKSLS